MGLSPSAMKWTTGMKSPGFARITPRASLAMPSQWAPYPVAPLSKQRLDLASSSVHYLRRKMLPPVAIDRDHKGLTS